REIGRRLLAILVFAQVHHPDFVSNVVAGEVNDDVITFGDTLLVKLGQNDRARQQVTVIGDLDHGGSIAQRDLKEARDAGVQNAEAILAALHFEIRLESQVHGHYVAQEAIEVEDVHE